MFTNSTVLEAVIKSKGLNIHKVYLLMGKNRKVYTAFENNLFTAKFIKELEGIIGEDLSMFIK